MGWIVAALVAANGVAADPARDWLEGVVADLPPPGNALRFRISTEARLSAVLIWDGAGALVFPDPQAMGFPEDAALVALAEVLAGRRSDWGAVPVRDPLVPERGYYCPEARPVCLVLDSAEMEASFGAVFEPPAGRKWPWALLVLGGFGAVIGGGVAWRRRGGGARPDSTNDAPEDLTDDLADDPNALRLGAVVLHPARQKARVAGAEVDLTARDVAMLRCLIARAGEVVSKDDLYDAGWGRDYMPNSRALDQQVRVLRKKLGDPGLIETVHGQGYRVNR